MLRTVSAVQRKCHAQCGGVPSTLALPRWNSTPSCKLLCLSHQRPCNESVARCVRGGVLPPHGLSWCVVLGSNFRVAWVFGANLGCWVDFGESNWMAMTRFRWGFVLPVANTHWSQIGLSCCSTPVCGLDVLGCLAVVTSSDMQYDPCAWWSSATFLVHVTRFSLCWVSVCCDCNPLWFPFSFYLSCIMIANTYCTWSCNISLKKWMFRWALLAPRWHLKQKKKDTYSWWELETDQTTQ